MNSLRRLVLLALLAAPALPAAAQEEECYRGRPVSEWVRGLDGADPLLRLDSARAVAELGPRAKAAVPALVRALADRDRDLVFLSILALGRIGPDALAAAPALREVLRAPEPDIRFHAAIALGKIGDKSPEAVAVLLEALRSDELSSSLKASAVEALGCVGGESSEVVAFLLDTLRSDRASSAIRVAAAKALGRLGLHAKETAQVVQVLVDAVASTGAPLATRLEALMQVEAMGKSARPAVPDLVAITVDPDCPRFLKQEIWRRLGAIDGDDHSGRQALHHALASHWRDKDRILRLARQCTDRDSVATMLRENPEYEDRDWLTYGIRACAGPRPLPEWNLFLHYFLDRDLDAATAAVDALFMEPGASLTALEDMLGSPDPHKRRVGALALGMRGGTARGSCDRLWAATDDPDYLVRRMAFRSLDQVDPEALRRSPGLRRLQNDPDPVLRTQALALQKELRVDRSRIPELVELLDSKVLADEARTQLVSFGEDSVPELVRALGRQEREIRAGALRALRELRERGEVPPDDVKPLADDPDPEVRRFAAEVLSTADSFDEAAFALREAGREGEGFEEALWALTRLGPRAIPKLVEVLSDRRRDPYARRVAALALGKIERRTGWSRAAGPLAEALKDPSPRVRIGAAIALGRIGTGAHEAVPALAEALADPFEAVRLEAARSIGSIGADALREDRPLGSPLPGVIQRVRAAVPALERALEDPDPQVREAAKEALYSIRRSWK